MRGLLCVLVLAVAGWAWGTTEQPLLRCDSGREFARAFREKTGDWTVKGSALTGSSPHYRDQPGTKLDGFIDDAHTFFVVHGVNLWRTAVAGDAKWTDYTLETTVHILSPAPLDGIRPGQDNVFINYQWGREAMGCDAGLLVRYQGPDCYYAVRLSSGYSHVELWKTKGGVVCVKPYAFAPGKDYKVAVTASGRWITVAVDGAEVLRYYDPVEPILAGKVALGVRESQVAFSKLRVSPVPANTETPVHTPAFHFRSWVGRNYIFDGDEPIAHLDKMGASIQEMKLSPGLMPMMINQPGASWGTDWKDDVRIKVQQEGASLAFVVEQDDKTGKCAGANRWTLTYDPAVGYIWDLKETITALVDGKCRWAFDLADPCFYQTVAPATDKLPQCRTHPNYALYTRTDGKYGYFPANHQCRDNNASSKDLAIRPGGFFATTVDDWAAVVEIPADNPYQYFADYCFWGLDQHVEHFTDPTQTAPAKQGDYYYGHARFYPLPPARVQQFLAEAVLPADTPGNHAEMLAHVEPVNHCTDVVQAVAGDSKVRWRGEYAIDRTVGHGDKCSMRITPNAKRGGTATATTDQIGPSYRTGPYLAQHYRFGLWVKADQFTGTVALKVDNIVCPVKRDFTHTDATLNITDKCDWTHVSFTTDFPRYAHYWNMLIQVQGAGTVWVDDMEITPLD